MLSFVLYNKDRTGRHIVKPDGGGKRINKFGDPGIVGEDGDGIIVIVETIDHRFENGLAGMVQIRDEVDLFFFYVIFTGEELRGLAGPFGGAGYVAIDGDTGLDQPFGHCGRIPLAPIVQRPVDIAHGGVVPAAFGMSDE